MSVIEKINKKKKRITFGKLKKWQARLSTYVSMVNFVMIFYLFIVENEWFEWYVWIIITITIVSMIVSFDVLVVMEQELDYSFKKNPEWRKHKRNQKRIMEKLGLEYEE